MPRDQYAERKSMRTGLLRKYEVLRDIASANGRASPTTLEVHEHTTEFRYSRPEHCCPRIGVR